MCLSIATDAVCCAGMACCQVACCCCKSCFGSTFKEQVKLGYIFLNVTVIALTMVLFYYVGWFVDQWASFITCPSANENCMGVSTVYRMSFVLAIMYALLIICMLFRGEFAKAANEGLWALKLLQICIPYRYIFVFFIVCIFIPNGFFNGYVQFAIVISGIYMLFQLVMLIDVFYLWGQNWAAVYDAGGEYMKYVLIITTAILYSGSITLNVYNFIWFSCGLNVFMNIFTLVLIVLFTGVQLLGWNPQGSLLTSSAMALYITYVTFSAQSSNPDKECNAMYNKSGVTWSDIIVGFIMSIVALLYMTLATVEDSAGVIKTGEGTDAASNLMQTKEEKTQDQAADEEKLAEDEEKQPLKENLTQQEKLAEAQQIVKAHETAMYASNQWVVFHIVMFVTVVYMAMMVTNWGAPQISASTNQAWQPSAMSFWIKIVTSWCAALLYVWTLIAPHIFPDREFN